MLRDPIQVHTRYRRPFRGKQGQLLTPIVDATSVPDTSLSVLDVTMPPRTYTKPHLHEHTDITVRVTRGEALTLTGEDLTEAYLHSGSSALWIPAGVPHVAVNVSEATLTAIEVRSDPHGDEDTMHLTDLDDRVAERIAQACEALGLSWSAPVTGGW